MPETPRLPLFYTMVASLDRQTHGALRLDTAAGYRFAQETNAVPLSLSELGAAAAHHPIVLGGGDGPAMPAAMVGYRDAENLLVGPDGSWSTGSYIPCYLRVYPFIFIEPAPEADVLTLGVEARSPLLSETRGEPLFEAGEPTALLQERLALADSYRRDLAATRAFGEALTAAGLLVPQEAKLDFAAGGTHLVTGFRGIDPARFDALPEATVAEWWKNGYLAACFAILHSQHRWGDLLRRAEQRGPLPAAAA